MLTTAFSAFGRFAANPSALVAERLGRPYVLLEVAYAAADEFVARLDPDSFDRAVLLGVAGNSSSFRLETRARNQIDPIPDVRGELPAHSIIDSTAPSVLAGTLWPADLLAHPPCGVGVSDDAGGYLCNYLYFRMLQRFTTKPIGFLHVPPLEKMALDQQVAIVSRLLEPLDVRPPRRA